MPPKTPFTTQQATQSDGETLAQLRIAAMKPSLEAIGRFDPERARSRFLSGFEPANTYKVLVNVELAGFYVVQNHTTHLKLDHLYLHPDYQGKGLGKAIVNQVKALAIKLNTPIQLGALRESASNRFYQREGFVQQSEDEWDIYYQWCPE
jgi:GNAT superfamily N-acetyltransferase